MKFGWRRTIRGAMVTMTVFLLGLVAAAGQTGPDQNPQMSDVVFKNVQVLKGIPVDQFMDAMGMFSSSLGYDCSSCHSQDIHYDRAAFATTTPLITRARQMIAMMNGLNEANFGGRPRVTSFTSFVARGTYGGFNTGGADLPIEIDAKVPNQRMQIVRAPDADNIKTYDGRKAWVAEGWRPLPLMELTGGNLEGARIEALTSFPSTIKDAFTGWQVGSAAIDDKPVQVLQGRTGGQPVNFYFDDTGLLVRSVR